MRRNKVEAAIIHPRHSFSGNQAEKAYLIGFRLGDLNVRMDLPTSKTIHVRCGTTIPAQVDLIRGLFEPYGHVNTRKGTIGETQVECHLDMSFDFLLPKEDRVPDWVTPDDPVLLGVSGWLHGCGEATLAQKGKEWTCSHRRDRKLRHRHPAWTIGRPETEGCLS